MPQKELYKWHTNGENAGEQSLQWTEYIKKETFLFDFCYFLVHLAL